MHARRALLVSAAALTVLVLSSLPARALPIVDPSVPAARETEPVVLTGASFPGWSVPANQTVKVPLTDLATCPPGANTDNCKHNNYAQPEVDTAGGQPAGTPTDRLLGYRWDAGKQQWRQIRFQVDELFTRYLDNSASGFGVYSGEDQHTTYAYDREGFRYTQNDPGNPCLAKPDSPPQADPVKGLDNNDELAFMASDGGEQAPAGQALPAGIEDARQVVLADPTNPSVRKYVYVMKSSATGPRSEFGATGYVNYNRDNPLADTYEKSQSDYQNYGNAARGPYCDANGNLVTKTDGTPDIQRRRPRDYATVTTPRYRFRYDGRWLLSDIRISPDDHGTSGDLGSYGPDLVDRWKARAFQQDPSSHTPCCGFEEEDTHWGGSSTLLGERVGPVRAIRETWGADSGTNVIRRETFYRDEVRMKTWLRVHVIPPLDGIYAQWDFNAGRMTRFYNSHQPGGVAVDGRNDEAYGNLDDPCNDNYHGDTSIDQSYREFYKQDLSLCKLSPYHQSIDVPDFGFADANAALGWSETAGPSGTIVDRYSATTDTTALGTGQSIVAVPYYRDDSCFDDGTGTDPGPRVNPGSSNEPRTYDPTPGSDPGDDATPRKCWTPADGVPAAGDPRFYQGDIGTHGVHFLFVAESDNARQTVPLDEIVAEQRMVMLPGEQGNVGEQYGRGFEKPLLPVVTPFNGGAAGSPPGGGTNPGGGNGSGSGTAGGGNTPGTGPQRGGSGASNHTSPSCKARKAPRRHRSRKHHSSTRHHHRARTASRRHRHAARRHAAHRKPACR